MTVAELLKQLQSFPPDTKVVVRGYENGYNDILKFRVQKIKPNPTTHWFDGEYEESDDADAIDSIDLYGENQNPKDD